MKHTLKILSLILCLLLVASVMFTACGKEDGTEDNTTDTTTNTTEAATSTDYSGLDLDKYIKLGTYKRVKSRYGLVKDKQFFCGAKCARKQNALLLTAGKRGKAFVFYVRNAKQLHIFLGLLAVLRLNKAHGARKRAR